MPDPPHIYQEPPDQEERFAHLYGEELDEAEELDEYGWTHLDNMWANRDKETE